MAETGEGIRLQNQAMHESLCLNTRIIVISSTGRPVVLDADLFELLRLPRITVRVVVDGDVRFVGTVDELRTIGFDRVGLAGEHPLERAVRHLTTTPPVRSAR